MPAHDNHESKTMDYDDHIRAAIDDLEAAAQIHNNVTKSIVLVNARVHINEALARLNAAAFDLRDASR